MRSFLISVTFVCAASTTVLADCPPPPDHSAALQELMEQARGAETEAQGRSASDKMWQLWLMAPDEAAQAILDRGMSKRSSFDLLGALKDFSTLIEYCPNYAEGYNQRAFTHYLREEFEQALSDLDFALELSPDHVGARSGRALTHMQMGAIVDARSDLKAALNNNPWLSERHLLSPGAPLDLPGEDI